MTLPPEPDPIDPEVTPGEEITDPEVPAPDASIPSEPRNIPDPVSTGAQPADDPNTEVIGDPDSKEAAVAANDGDSAPAAESSPEAAVVDSDPESEVPAADDATVTEEDVSLSTMVLSDNTAGTAGLILILGLILLVLGKSPVRWFVQTMVRRRRAGGAHK